MVLALLSGGAQVELSEPVLVVGPLFLAGDSFDGRFVVLFRGGILLPGGIDLALALR